MKWPITADVAVGDRDQAGPIQGLQGYPVDHAERLPMALGAMEGWSEVIMALLR